MNQLMVMNNEVTMSSREIAELVGKEHKHVMRDLRVLSEQLGDMFEGVVQTWTHPQNKQQYEEYAIKRDTCVTLLTGYDSVSRMKVIKRWQELESKQGPQIPQTYAAALLEAGRLALEVEQKNHLLEVQAPKVAFADRVAGDDKGVNIGNYARAVGLGQNTLFRALRDNHILMSGGNRHNLPLQDYIERGYFTVKEGTRTHNDETVPTFTPMVTGKGQQWLTRRLIDLGYLKPIAA